MLCRVALGTQKVEQRINSEVYIKVLLKPMSGLLMILSSTLIYTSELILMGLSSTLIYTSELILCSTICVPSGTRHNIHMCPKT